MMGLTTRRAKVLTNWVSLVAVRGHVVGFLKTACRTVSGVTKMYNLDDAINASQLHSTSSYQFHKHAHITKPKPERLEGNRNGADLVSHLEMLLGNDNIREAADKKDGEFFLPDEEFSKDNPEDMSAHGSGDSLAPLRREIDKKAENGYARKRITSPLFKVLMEAPCYSVKSVLNKWVAEGNPVQRDEISISIFHLRKLRFYEKALQFVEWLEAKNYFNFVEHDYASHLDLIAKVHGLQKAESYIEEVPESFRGEMVYRTLLANYVSAGKAAKAEEIFNKMRMHKLPISTFSCDQLLLLYIRFDWNKIPDILLMMEKENIQPSMFTYRLLIDMKGRADDITGMEQILETMKAKGLEPDIIILAMVAEHYIVAGLTNKAETTTKKMEGNDIKLNRSACKALLPLYAALGRSEDVGRVWMACKANPRLHECVAAIEAWGKLGHIEDAEKIFEEMLQSRKKLSSTFYNTLLWVYANNKLLDKGKELVKRMSNDGCRLGPLTWHALVKLYVDAGQVEKADVILQKAAEQKEGRPLYSSYITLLEQYSKRGDVHSAERIFHCSRQVGYPGRMRKYRLLLEAYINANTPAYGFRERMKAENVVPSKQVAAILGAAEALRQ